jgi:hypothetical protein
MSLWKKSVLVYTTAIGGGLIVGISCASFLSADNVQLAFPILLFWVVGWGIGIQAVLRCPQCGMPATLTPGGWYVPWVGDTCRYCGKPD